MATPTTAGRVIIGQGITVKGDIKNCEEVIVRGFFDAGNVEAKTVVVESDGKPIWDISAALTGVRSIARVCPVESHGNTCLQCFQNCKSAWQNASAISPPSASQKKAFRLASSECRCHVVVTIPKRLREFKKGGEISMDLQFCVLFLSSWMHSEVTHLFYPCSIENRYNELRLHTNARGGRVRPLLRPEASIRRGDFPL